MTDVVVEAIRRATADVCLTMLDTPVESGNAFAEKKPPEPIDGVVSLIGLAGVWIGIGSLNCSPALACSLSGKLLMTEFESVNDEVLDAIAELTNMIIGNVKTTLEAELGPMALSIPTVVFGRNFTTRSVGTEEWTVVPFDLPEGRLDVKLCLARGQAQGNAIHTRLAVQVP